MLLLAKKFVRVFVACHGKPQTNFLASPIYQEWLFLMLLLWTIAIVFISYSLSYIFAPLQSTLQTTTHFPKRFDTFLSKNIYSLHHHLLNIPKLSGIQGLPQSTHKSSSLPLFLSSCLFGLLPSHSFLINKWSIKWNNVMVILNKTRVPSCL